MRYLNHGRKTKIDQGNCRNLLYLNHHLIKNNQIYSIEKLIANELYSFSISLRNTVPTSQKYLKFFFSKSIFYVQRCLYPSSHCNN